MLDDIQATLNHFAQRDGRLHYCLLTVDHLENERCTLSGAVLDAATLDEVAAELQAHFPSLCFETTQVKILSSAYQKKRMVTTNITSVMSEPSWRSEQLSQVMAGWLVEVLLEQEAWSFVRLARDNGYLGWVYRAYLADETPPPLTHMVYRPTCLLHTEPTLKSDLVSRVWAGMEVAVTAVSAQWAQISLAGGIVGWLPQIDLRALNSLPKTEQARRQQIVKFAYQLIGVPYVWGGRSASGIDCSGLAELSYRLSGVVIPRDADMQFAAGQEVETPFKPGDLLFFGSDQGHRSISHVAISLGGWHIIHSSRARNGVYLDDVQAETSLRDSYRGTRTFL